MRTQISNPRSRGNAQPGLRTRDQLYDEAKALDIPGRSAMDRDELEAAIDRRRGRTSAAIGHRTDERATR